MANILIVIAVSDVLQIDEISKAIFMNIKLSLSFCSTQFHQIILNIILLVHFLNFDSNIN